MKQKITGRNAVAQLVKALRYKPEGRGIDSPSGRNMALGSTEPLIEKSLKSMSWRVKTADT